MLRSIPAHDFVRLEVPPRRHIIEPFLPERGLIEIYASSGIGKSSNERSFIALLPDTMISSSNI